MGKAKANGRVGAERGGRPPGPALDDEQAMRLELGERLRAARRAAGWETAAAAARKLGTLSTKLNLIERGGRLPGYALLRRMVADLGYDVRILFPEGFPDPKR